MIFKFEFNVGQNASNSQTAFQKVSESSGLHKTNPHFTEKHVYHIFFLHLALLLAEIDGDMGNYSLKIFTGSSHLKRINRLKEKVTSTAPRTVIQFDFTRRTSLNLDSLLITAYFTAILNRNNQLLGQVMGKK